MAEAGLTSHPDKTRMMDMSVADSHFAARVCDQFDGARRRRLVDLEGQRRVHGRRTACMPGLLVVNAPR
jgi:hypothetical protein